MKTRTRCLLRAAVIGVVATLLYTWDARAESTGVAQLVFMPDTTRDAIEVVENVQGPPNAGGGWRVSLPAGYSDLRVDGASYTLQGNTLDVATTDSLVFSFELPLHGLMGLQWTFVAPEDLGAVQLWVPEDGTLAVSADNLFTFTRQTTAGDRSFRVLTRSAMSTGETWTLSVQKLPSATDPPPGADLPALSTPLDNRHQVIQALSNLILAAVMLGLTVWGLRVEGRPRRRWKEARPGAGVGGGAQGL